MKAIIYVLFVFLPFFVKGQCNPLSFGILKAEVSSDSVVLKNDTACRNCGAYYSMEIISINNDTLIWIQKDIGALAFCYCNFNLSVTVDSLTAGNYTAMVYFTEAEQDDTIYIGSVSFTINDPNPYLSPSIRNQEQSPCFEVTGLPSDKKSTVNALKIHPNPIDGKITIETSETVSDCHMYIINLNGKELFHQTLTKPKTLINISDLPQGIYLVKVVNDKTVQVGKVIKW